MSAPITKRVSLTPSKLVMCTELPIPSDAFSDSSLSRSYLSSKRFIYLPTFLPLSSKLKLPSS